MALLNYGKEPVQALDSLAIALPMIGDAVYICITIMVDSSISIWGLGLLYADLISVIGITTLII